MKYSKNKSTKYSYKDTNDATNDDVLAKLNQDRINIEKQVKYIEIYPHQFHKTTLRPLFQELNDSTLFVTWDNLWILSRYADIDFDELDEEYFL